MAKAKLPTALQLLSATNIDNRVLIFGMIFCEPTVICIFIHSLTHVKGGGTAGSPLHSVDTILEYDITRDEYQEIGHMLEPRNSHAISVVQYSDLAPWCH